MPDLITEYPQFFTVTCLGWKRLLQPDKYKTLVVESLRFLVVNNRVIVYGFVIMTNHLHLIWQMKGSHHPQDIQRDFLKFTGQQIKQDLLLHHPQVLEHFKVQAQDRHYQLWERNALSVELRREIVLSQKLDYIHHNPVRAGLCILPEAYHFSSAHFYETGKDNWGLLTHYKN
ncbi:transposase [Flavisolibacter tropicus]|uniref:Transposase n=2 Tax=Flavisolibacter tropicus TaxID=1492898 RepID=A0A172U316_9BACT|nr:transposase [Flavisolibacter tropicus]